MIRFRTGLGLLGLSLLSGCAVVEGQRIDQEVAQATRTIEALDAPPPCAGPDSPALAGPELQPVAFLQGTGLTGPPRQFRVPDELPGAQALPIALPPGKEARQRYREQLYPPLTPLSPRPAVAPGPEGHPMSLGDLQRLAEWYSPAIKNAAAAVDAAKGAVEQSGAYPNPTFAFEHDTVQTGQAGYPGFSLEQVVKTGNKLKLQQAAATMDLLNARLALRRARTDLSYQVRTSYFAVLNADEGIRVNAALYRFIGGLYNTQVDLSESIEGALYEPMLLRPLALQARLNYEQAINQYHASWRQLAATLGLPDMPPAELEGRVDHLPLPDFDYDAVLARVLSEHTDVRTAIVNLQKAQYQLALAQLVPLPDLDMKVLVQKDYTSYPSQIVESFTVGVPIPVWDQNKGGIRQAHGQLAQAAVGPEQARNTLRGTLADAFNRYRTARLTVELSRQQIEDQIRAYRGLYDRYTTTPADVGGFSGVVAAQQTLGGYLAGYLTALTAQWQAVADIANLLQTDDLFQAAPLHDCAPLPDLEHLLPAPPGHGCQRGPAPACPPGLRVDPPRSPVGLALPTTPPAPPPTLPPPTPAPPATPKAENLPTTPFWNAFVSVLPPVP